MLSFGDVGAEPGRVGQCAGLLDRAQEGGDAAVVAAQLEDLLDHGAVLARQLLGVLVVGVAVVDLLHLDAQGLAVTVLAGARRHRPGRGGGRPRSRPGAPRRERPRSITSATTPTRPYSPSLRGSRKTLLLLADVDRQSRGNAGEDDRIVKRNQEIGHV